MKWSLLAHRITPCTPSPPLRAKSSGATPRVGISSPLRQLPTSLSTLAHKMAPCMHSPVTGSGTTPRVGASNPLPQSPDTWSMSAHTTIEATLLLSLLLWHPATHSHGTAYLRYLAL